MKKIIDIKDLFHNHSRSYLFHGDCFKLLKSLPDESVDLIITSPPYCMKKAYENIKDDIHTFEEHQKNIIPDIYRVLKNGGSVCWQVGYHVAASCAIPLDYYIYKIFSEYTIQFQVPLILRNRIIWTFGHGLNATQRFSGRHETIMWFTKGNDYNFNLDDIRIPQKYPGKRSYKGKNKGEFSGNPLGKNPSDVWDIPNVKANHIEKTVHPCQFPIAIPKRFIKALTSKDSIVLDPFMGSGTSGAAAIMEGRYFIGAEIMNEYFALAETRIDLAARGELKYREDIPTYEPDPKTEVAKLPEEFKRIRMKK